MKKSTKIIIFTISILILIKIFPYTRFFYYGHNTDFYKQKNYVWFFKKEFKKDLDKFGSCSYTNNDFQNCFNYLGNSLNLDMGYLFTIWEFKNQSHLKISDIKILNSFDNLNKKIDDGEIINAESELSQYIKYNYSFKNGININVDNRDTIKYIYKGLNFFGCYGNFHSISIGNEKEKNQIIFYNDFNKPLTSIICFKKKSRFYIITVESDRFFNPDILNILNIGKVSFFENKNIKKRFKYTDFIIAPTERTATELSK